MALPSKGGVQAGPEVLVVGQGCQGARGVAVALVQEGGEGRVHALGTLGAPKLLCFKHLHTQQGQGQTERDSVFAESSGKKTTTKIPSEKGASCTLIQSWENREKGHLILRWTKIIDK